MTCYLASYPRSGNSFLRLILYYHFGIRTFSEYGAEFADYPSLSVIEDPQSNYLKTHRRYDDSIQGRHIYIERNAEDNAKSFLAYYGGKHTKRWGTQAEHIESWRNSGALWLHFEYLKSATTLDRLEAFLGRPRIENGRLPTFEALHTEHPHNFRNAGFTERNSEQ